MDCNNHWSPGLPGCSAPVRMLLPAGCHRLLFAHVFTVMGIRACVTPRRHRGWSERVRTVRVGGVEPPSALVVHPGGKAAKLICSCEPVVHVGDLSPTSPWPVENSFRKVIKQGRITHIPFQHTSAILQRGRLQNCTGFCNISRYCPPPDIIGGSSSRRPLSFAGSVPGRTVSRPKFADITDNSHHQNITVFKPCQGFGKKKDRHIC